MASGRLTVYGVLAPSLERALAAGRRHEILGWLFDGGSYARVSDAPVGPEGLRSLLDVESRPGTLRLGGTAGLEEAGAWASGWHELVADGEVLSVVLADQEEQEPPVLIVYGHAIPCMGALPDCRREDVHATWRRLAGADAGGGRFLLEEPDSMLEPEVEEQLTERLRLLYGE